MSRLTVLVPTFNEADNVEQLVAEIERATRAIDVDVLFVDDSTDGRTPEEIRRVSEQAGISVRLIHREGAQRTGGLSGAVTHGLRHARGEYVTVMDGDLQHPPSLLPELLHYAEASDSDLVVASRYCGDGDAGGLNGGIRKAVSSGSTLLARSVFPRRVGSRTTDPMTGFFCLRRSSLRLNQLHPRGFKILLEILVAHPAMKVAEIPFAFGERFAGESKASLANGWQFLVQLADLRIPRAARFALVGATGVLVNLLVLAGLLGLGVPEVAGSILATFVAMCTNFVLQETTVFHDLRRGSKNKLVHRFWKCLAASAVVEVVRVPAFIGLNHVTHALIAQALTVLAAAALRYKLTHRVYRPETVAVIPNPSAEMKVVETV